MDYKNYILQKKDIEIKTEDEVLLDRKDNSGKSTYNFHKFKQVKLVFINLIFLVFNTKKYKERKKKELDGAEIVMKAPNFIYKSTDDIHVSFPSSSFEVCNIIILKI